MFICTFYVIKTNKYFSVLSYVPCAFYLFIATYVRARLGFYYLGNVFSNNFLKIIS